ncbi:MAG: SLC13 family permease [Yaniella sp.]|uniref:SLC13 family permease n=3 Tax=Yaniella sp. TaxID=2773929 RepID=UPI002649BF79|nr:SLC13 family permease [Yaniella sp.]MDN6172002.1 arsenic transporter [Yaniella sp.]MDN6356977.1 arsenic transporter [Yaniella sp.]
MGPRITTGAMLLAVVATIALVTVELSEAVTLAWRLLPIFIFVAGMSVVTNISAQVGVFNAVAQALERTAPNKTKQRRRVLWAGIVLISIVVTVFLSLDTTAILLTPLAITLAKRNQLNLVAVALAVVWIANIASLHLPVSNLTNLLALSGKGFTSEFDFISTAAVPAIVATTIAVFASLLANRLPQRLANSTSGTASGISETSSPLLKPMLIIVAVLLPALASSIPYWLSSTVAAAAVLAITVWKQREIISVSLIPWSALVLAGALSTVATTLNAVGGEEIVRGILGDTQATPMGLLQLAGAGALTANLINNIPAFLALEPALTTSNDYLAMLIGTNTGPIITPWASLATLLWYDQLQRAGVQIRWRTFIALGLILAPLAVILPTLGLLL